MKQWRDLTNIFNWHSDRDLFADEFDPRKSWRRLLVIFFVGLIGLSIISIIFYYSWFGREPRDFSQESATSTLSVKTISTAADLIKARFDKFESASIVEIKLPDPSI